MVNYGVSATTSATKPATKLVKTVAKPSYSLIGDLHGMQVLYQLSYDPKSQNIIHINQFKDFFRNVRNSYSTL